MSWEDIEINTENDAVEIFQGTDGKYYWHRFDEDNGLIVVDGGGGRANQNYCIAAAHKYCPDLPDTKFYLTPERR